MSLNNQSQLPKSPPQVSNQHRALSQAIQDLISNGVPSNKVSSQPNFLVEDIYPAMRPYFTDEAGKALHNKSQSILHQYNEEVCHTGLANILLKLKIKSAINIDGYVRKAAVCQYFGGSCERKDVDQMIIKIVNAINDLASKKFIKAALSPLSIMRMHTAPTEPARYIVVSYIHLTQPGEEYAVLNLADIKFEENGMPKSFEEMK